jgi:hypothetical protein
MATVKGTTPPAFGITDGSGSLDEFESGCLTQSISLSEKVEKKEGRDGVGDVKWLAYYGENALSAQVSFTARRSLPTEATKTLLRPHSEELHTS